MKSFEIWLSRCLEFLLAICLFAMASIIITLVIMRYCFNASATGANEWVTILFAYATSFGAALAIGRNEHISISFAVEWLPDSVQKYIDRFGILLVAFLNLILIVESLGWIQVTGDYLMPATGLPRKIAQLCVPLGCGVAFVYCVLRLWLPDPDSVPNATEPVLPEQENVAMERRP